MKRIITLLALLAVTAAAAHAQADSLVTFDTHGDRLGISIGGFSISLGENAESGSKIDEIFFSEAKRNRITTNFLGVSLGGMVLTPSPYYGPWEGQNDFLDIYPASSTRIDLMLVNWTVPLDRRGRTYYKIGMLYSYDSYCFRKNITFVNDDDDRLMPVDLDGNIKYTRLKANYWGLNMGFGFKVSSMMFTVQGTAELLTGSYVKYKNPGKTKYQVNGPSPFRSRVSISTNWEGYGFYIDYSLTPVFKEGTGNDAHSLSLGCRMGF